MKYMLLIYDNAQSREAFFGPDGEALMAEVNAVMKELTESGELVGGEALADPSNTRTVRVLDGVPAVTDGPFVEAKEHLGGYLMVECETPERAADIAVRWPSARFTPLEVRPIMDQSGPEL
ncbi:MAG: YCII-related protein [Solirubrobacterales bacterium]|nr:YCII-related protein [Solirubrobacterales bacterium]